MRYLFILLITLFGLSFSLQAQVPTTMSGKLQIYAVSGSSPSFGLQGFFSDDLSYYSADSVSVGDKVYVLEGSECWELTITAISTNTGSLLNCTVRDSTGLLSGISLGQGAIMTHTPNKQIPVYISTLRDDLRSCIMNRFALKADSITETSNIDSLRISNDSIFHIRNDGIIDTALISFNFDTAFLSSGGDSLFIVQQGDTILYKPNITSTDNQNLGLDNYELSIEDGNTVNLDTLFADTSWISNDTLFIVETDGDTTIYKKTITSENLGIGSQIFKEISNDSLKFRTIVPGTGINIAQNDTSIVIINTGDTDPSDDISGSGVADRIAIWSSPTDITSDANITYDGTTFTVNGSTGELLCDFGDLKIYESGTGSYILFENGVGLSPISQARTGWVSHQFYNSGGNMFRMDAHGTDTLTLLIEPGKRPPSLFEALGRVYVDVDDNTIYFFDGTSWVDLAASGGTGESNVITSDTELTDVDTLRRGTTGGIYGYDKGLTAEMKIGYDYVIDSVVNVLGGNFELGKYVNVVETQARYLIQADTIEDFVTDSLVVIPLASNYAVLSPPNNILTPQMFRAKGDGVNNDTDEIQEMFDFVQNRINNTGGNKFNCYFPNGSYYINDIITMPSANAGVLGGSGVALNARLTVDFGGSKIFSTNKATTGGFFMGVLGEGSVTDNLNYQIKNGNFFKMTKPLTLVGLARSEISQLNFTEVDTALHIPFGLGNRIIDCDFGNNNYNFIGENASSYQGGSGSDSEFNANIIESCRVYCGSTTVSCFEFHGSDMNFLKNCITEGLAPEYNVLINMTSNNNRALKIHDLWVENAVGPDSAVIYIKNRNGLQLEVDGLQTDRAVTLIKATSNVAIGSVRLIDVPVSASETIDIANGSGWTFDIQYNGADNDLTSGANFKNLITAAFINDIPQRLMMHGGGNYFTNYFHLETDLNFDGSNVDGYATLNANIVGTNNHIVGQKGATSNYGERYRGYFAHNLGFINGFSGRFGWGGQNYFGGYSTTNLNYLPYQLYCDTTSSFENISILPFNNNGELKLYKTGKLRLEGYGSAYDMSASALSEIFHTYLAVSNTGSLIHMDSVMAAHVYTGIDSARLDAELQGIITRLDDLGSGGSLPTGVNNALYRDSSGFVVQSQKLKYNGNTLTIGNPAFSGGFLSIRGGVNDWDQIRLYNGDNNVYASIGATSGILSLGRGSSPSMYIDASNIRSLVKLGYSSTVATYSLDWEPATDGIRIPSGTTAQRTGTGVGVLRYNESQTQNEISTSDGSYVSVDKSYCDFALTSSSDAMTASTSYGDITGTSIFADGFESSLLTHADGVATYTGSLTKLFKVDCSGTVVASDATMVIDVAPVDNGTTIGPKKATVKCEANSTPEGYSISAIVELSNAQTFKLQWKTSGTSGTVTFTNTTCVLTQLD